MPALTALRASRSMPPPCTGSTAMAAGRWPAGACTNAKS